MERGDGDDPPTPGVVVVVVAVVVDRNPDGNGQDGNGDVFVNIC